MVTSVQKNPFECNVEVLYDVSTEVFSLGRMPKDNGSANLYDNRCIE